MGIYFYGCITMDGYLADKAHNLDWLYQSGTVEETGYDDFYDNMDIVIMGKRTYDEIAKADNAMDCYPATENYVFTHSKTLSHHGFTPISENVVEFVKRIDANKNIWIVGGNTILAPLLDNDMVDHIILQIAPVLLGEGVPLFTQKEAFKRFHLKEVRQYGQFAELIYEKIHE